MTQIADKMLARQVRLQCRMAAASESATLSRDAQRTSLASGMLLGAIATPAAALAADPCAGSKDAANQLSDLIGRAGGFLIMVGLAVALFMITLGGFRIVAGHKESAVREGMKNVKNALVGLAIMLLGVFIQKVVVKFATGLAGADGAPQSCL